MKLLLALMTLILTSNAVAGVVREDKGDSDGLWHSYERLQAAADNLRQKLDDAQRKYA